MMISQDDTRYKLHPFGTFNLSRINSDLCCLRNHQASKIDVSHTVFIVYQFSESNDRLELRFDSSFFPDLPLTHPTKLYFSLNCNGNIFSFIDQSSWDLPHIYTQLAVCKFTVNNWSLFLNDQNLVCLWIYNHPSNSNKMGCVVRKFIQFVLRKPML